MNPISKTHKRFSDRLRNSRVLENPEEFMGKNFEAVLNFWLILDELSKDQLRVVNERYKTFYDEKYSKWLKAANLAVDASEGVVDEDYVDYAGEAAYDVTISWVARCATRELIGMHKILEDHQQPLTFFEIILEVL